MPQLQEQYRPRFWYTSFQYVQVSNPLHPPALDDLQCDFLHTALDIGGTMAVQPATNPPPPSVPRNHSEWDILNLVHTAAMRSILSNYFGYPSDCPSREKRGWLGVLTKKCGRFQQLQHYPLPPFPYRRHAGLE